MLGVASEHTSFLVTLSAWVTIVSGPLVLLGLGLAWVQLRRTARAAEATKAAVEKTARGMALYQLLILIPEMQQHEAALDEAVRSGDEDRAIEVLNAWRKAGTEIRGLLDSRPSSQKELKQLLQKSFVDAFDAKRELLAAGKKPLGDITNDARETIGKVTVQLGFLSGQLRANIGGDLA